ncbi:hypothetical protein B0H63DRAFT_141852 [Podospora didyma]|uniref:Uncharacterized protein n=1 Tax=Podospora didyma TaxID=330526 RepID=A0AAE0U106_9PEZI|nr:hypothetical protein B0H63DRAFT_141852 [Podospora didyma]
MADPFAVLAASSKCIKGLQIVHQHYVEFQRAELNVKTLMAQCSMLDLIISKIRDWYNSDDPDAKHGQDGRISLVLAESEEVLNELLTKLQPVLAIGQKYKKSKKEEKEKMGFGSRISAAWKNSDTEHFRARLDSQILMVNTLLTVLTKESVDEFSKTGNPKDPFGDVHEEDPSSVRAALDEESQTFRAVANDLDEETRSFLSQGPLGEKEFSFDAEILTSQTYRAMYARWERLSLQDQRRPEDKGSTSKEESEEGPAASASSPSQRGAAGSSTVSADPAVIIESYEEALPVYKKKTVTAQDVADAKERLRSWIELQAEIISLKYAHGGEGIRAEKSRAAESILSGLLKDVVGWEQDRTQWNDEELEQVNWLGGVLRELDQGSSQS